MDAGAKDRKIGSLALAACSGFLLASTFPSLGLWPLAWIALVPFFLSLRGIRPSAGLLLGWVHGFVFFAATIFWLIPSVHMYGKMPLPFAALITLLLCAYLALYPALFGLCCAYLQIERDLISLLAAPALWTALELFRTHVLSGFPWALLGYSQHPFLSLIQIADITGVYGISFLLVLANACIARMLLRPKSVIPLLVLIPVLVLVIVYGRSRLQLPDGEHAVTVAVIQGNIEQDMKWDPAYQEQTFATYKRLTLQSLSDRPDLVIWPETSTPFYFDGKTPDERRYTADLHAFVKAHRIALLFGSPTYETGVLHTTALRNSAFLLSRDGRVIGKYDKIHLVPFGEYVPLKRILPFVGNLVQSPGDFLAGHGYQVMSFQEDAEHGAEIKVGTVICYEIIFPDLVRQFVVRGAAVLTTITNDAWFGRTAAPYQHFAMAVFRAVENRVPIARAANTGVSGFIDQKGRLLAASPLFTEGVLTEKLRTGGELSLYTRWGDVFSYACVIVSMAILLLSPAARRPLS